MVCAPVRKDNPRAVARGLSTVQAHKPVHLFELCNTVSSRYLKVEFHPKLLISRGKLSGPRNFEISVVEMTGAEQCSR